MIRKTDITGKWVWWCYMWVTKWRREIYVLGLSSESVGLDLMKLSAAAMGSFVRLLPRDSSGIHLEELLQNGRWWRICCDRDWSLSAGPTTKTKMWKSGRRRDGEYIFFITQLMKGLLPGQRLVPLSCRSGEGGRGWVRVSYWSDWSCGDEWDCGGRLDGAPDLLQSCCLWKFTYLRKERLHSCQRNRSQALSLNYPLLLSVMFTQLHTRNFTAAVEETFTSFTSSKSLHSMTVPSVPPANHEYVE